MPYSFELHLRSLPCDPISHFFLGKWLEIPWPALMAMSPERKYELLNEELRRFHYVADYTYCDELVGLMGDRLGISAKPERVNTEDQWAMQTHWRPLTAEQLSPHIRREIAERTRLDQALWESWGQARLGTSTVQVVPLEKQRRFGFPLAEVRRPVYAAARRYLRGWFKANGC